MSAPNQFQASLTAADSTGNNPAGTLSVPLNGPNMQNCGSASVVLSGTFVGTVQFEASGDGGTTWVAIAGTPPGTSTPVTSATAPGVWQFQPAALTNIRARCSAFSSGTIVATINLSTAGFVASAA